MLTTIKFDMFILRDIAWNAKAHFAEKNLRAIWVQNDANARKTTNLSTNWVVITFSIFIFICLVLDGVKKEGTTMLCPGNERRHALLVSTGHTNRVDWRFDVLFMFWLLLHTHFNLYILYYQNYIMFVSNVAIFFCLHSNVVSNE